MNAEPVGLHPIDLSIILAYIVFAIGAGVYLSRRATRNITEYFISGRNAPWWLLGTSIVATTFASDTPLSISGMVVREGIANNWYWWNGALMGLFAAFFIARLWRRANIVTDTEFIEIRYSGKSAAFLRAYRALYFSLIYNVIVMGWVNLGMAKVLNVIFAMPKWQSVGICYVITLVYTALSGLWGVMVTDFVQFIIAMFGSIFLAFIAVSKMGGIQNILAQMASIYGPEKQQAMVNFYPFAKPALVPVSIFFVYLGLQWWSSGNTDGGGYSAQRMLSARSERDSFLGYLWYLIAHFCLRPWPWILVGLVAAVKFPYIADPITGKLPDPELGYIKAMVTFLPTGLLGIMLASFLAAYMSTIDTQLNWGASYLINDFYKRFIKKQASDRHYVVASVIATVFIATWGALATFLMSSIFFAWTLLTAIMAGVGVVYLLRWFWWRVNAWSEISAMATSLVMSILLIKVFKIDPRYTLYYTLPVSLCVWIPITLLTKPVEENKLIEFYKRVRPPAYFWKPIVKKIGDLNIEKNENQKAVDNLINYFLSLIAVYGALLGVGEFLLRSKLAGVILFILTFTSGYILSRRLKVSS